jgi:DNA (cytosine-5)-methyltransferase 1
MSLTLKRGPFLLAGFPCQPFSIAGVPRKNALGRPHGFECATQGTLFFDVARIIAAKRPWAFLLENVKSLLSHDGGNTFRVIRGVLEAELGYEVHAKVVDGGLFVPQHRERIMIAGFREPSEFDWASVLLSRSGIRAPARRHPASRRRLRAGLRSALVISPGLRGETPRKGQWLRM